MTTPEDAQAITLEDVTSAYADSESGELLNETLYARVAQRRSIPDSSLHARQPVGAAGTPRSTIKRAIRWHQQTLRAMGVLERVENSRGLWRLAATNDRGLSEAQPGVRLVAFSTNLGVAIWGECRDVLTGLQEKVALSICSPPYPLASPRAYGNATAHESEYVDFISHALEPIIRNLVDGGSLCINVGSVYIKGTPARSLYRERLILALCDRFSLSLVDRVVWHNPSSPPGPTRWACVKRVQLCNTYEDVLWFTNNAEALRSDNRRVLQPHSERHQKLIARGGENRTALFGDGAHRIAPGNFGAHTEGRIPRNVLTLGHRCPDNDRYRRYARDHELPVHGAMFPLSLVSFFIRLLTQPDELVIDPFGGSICTGSAAEQLGRRWIVVEKMLDYLRGGAGRFLDADGFHMSEHLASWQSVQL